MKSVHWILKLDYPTEIILPLIYNKGFCNWQKKLLGNHELNCFRSNFLKGSKSLALQSENSWKKLDKCFFPKIMLPGGSQKFCKSQFFLVVGQNNFGNKIPNDPII